jgi:hypothetical protein
MRRQLRFLLAAGLLTILAAPLAAIEYHQPGEAFPNPMNSGSGAADPLSVVQADDAGIPANGAYGAYGGECTTCDCDPCCCDGWIDGYYRHKSWNIRAEALWMERGQPEGNLFLTDRDGQFLGAGQFDFDVESGFDLSIMEFNADGHAWEIRYFWLNDWSQTIPVRMVDPVIETVPATPEITGVFDIDNTYISKLRSGEWNYLRATNYGTFIVGFRYFEVNELLSIFMTEVDASPLITQTNFATENDLFGLQVGYGAMIFQHGHWSVDGIVKGGVFYNDADVNVSFRSNANVSNDGGNEDDDVAFGTEARLTVTYQLPSGWSIRGGYQGVYLNDVALAGEQVPTTGPVIFTSPIFVQQNLGNVIYHGGFLGVEYNF